MYHKNERYLNKEYLYNAYVVEFKNTVQIAKETGLCAATIRYWAKKFGIKLNRGNAQNLKKKKYNNLTPIDYIPPKNYEYNSKWLCECDCGEKLEVDVSALKSGTTKRCKKCTRKLKKARIYTLERTADSYFNGLKKGASDRNLELAVDKDFIKKLYFKQNGLCSYTKVKLLSSYDDGGKRCIWTASLDRIDNTKGYVEGNVQWVHKDVNRMKWILKHEDFINICNLVAKEWPSNRKIEEVAYDSNNRLLW